MLRFRHVWLCIYIYMSGAARSRRNTRAHESGFCQVRKCGGRMGRRRRFNQEKAAETLTYFTCLDQLAPARISNPLGRIIKTSARRRRISTTASQHRCWSRRDSHIASTKAALQLEPQLNPQSRGATENRIEDHLARSTKCARFIEYPSVRRTRTPVTLYVGWLATVLLIILLAGLASTGVSKAPLFRRTVAMC